MKGFSFKSFTMGIIMCLLVVLLFSTSSIAAVSTSWISVTNGISIYVDDVKLNAVDGNGNAVEAFASNGTTYLPVKAISEAVGKAVSWDGKSRSVYIGKHDSTKPSVMLYDMEYFNKSDDFTKVATVTDQLGNNYNNAINLKCYWAHQTAWQDYLIDGKYRNFSGSLIIRYDERATQSTGMIRMYGDDQLIYSSPTLTNGVNPINFNVDVEGVLKLRIEYVPSGDSDANRAFYLVNTGFYQ